MGSEKRTSNRRAVPYVIPSAVRNPWILGQTERGGNTHDLRDPSGCAFGKTGERGLAHVSFRALRGIPGSLAKRSAAGIRTASGILQAAPSGKQASAGWRTSHSERREESLDPWPNGVRREYARPQGSFRLRLRENSRARRCLNKRSFALQTVCNVLGTLHSYAVPK